MTLELPNGYDRKKKPEMLSFRPMVGREIAGLSGEFWFQSRDGSARRARVSGMVKTWKTRPNIERPLKYGMYENGYIVADSPDSPAVIQGTGLPCLVPADK